MFGRAPHPRSPLAATVALLALCLQTALPLLHSAQLDIDLAAPLGCVHVVSDGSAGPNTRGVDDAHVVYHDAEQCALCQAIQQGKRTIAAPGSTGTAHLQVRPADPVATGRPATGPLLRTTAPRGPPLHS
jgi:hypothetical protein